MKSPFDSLPLPVIVVLLLLGGSAFGADDDQEAALAAARARALKTFKDRVNPFIESYCIRCHGQRRRKGDFTFVYARKSPATPSFRPLWRIAAARLKNHDMPPEDSKKQPTDKERHAFIEWVEGIKYLSPKDPGEFVIRRLNRVEYGNTLHALFGVHPKLAEALPDEVLGAGYLNSISPLLMEKYLSIADEVLEQIAASPLQRKFFGAAPSSKNDEPVAARRVARSLARLAYRRPPSEAEIDVLMKVFGLARGRGKSYTESLRLVLKAVLVSPQFLFITPEGDAPADRDIVPVGDHQLASRLSYFLWAAPPDEKLLAKADEGTLHQPDVLAAQARRLLADPRSRALFDGFGAQWLGLDKLADMTFDPEKFPEMTPALRTAMVDEARLFFGSILSENRSVASFIDSDYSFLNETLAPLYGLEDRIRGSALRRVALKDANRGGILAMPGILATTSFPNRTSPVNRGVWVLEQVLGEHVPPPPADVPTLEKQDPKDIARLTLRERTELHRRDPTCASCHRVLDPIGFGLENFDAIGRWRDTDDTGGKIDPTGELPGNVRFTSPRELKRIIASRVKDFSRNLTARLLAYALCRQLDGYDEIVVDRIAAGVAKDDYRMQTLVIAVVTSYPFTHRRVRDLKGPGRGK